ncbi:MAG: hypothetical protein RJA81_694, partial [Planctomycetota bacterium]
FFSGSSTYAASSELQRIIRAGYDSKDRTYLLTTPDSKLKTRPRSTIASEKQPSVDGALLYVRGSDQYVFIRHDAGGSEFITGCDGKLAWSVPPRGRVRLSNDMNRFRGAVPGQQHDIPFIDIRENLNQLLNSYELSISDEDLNSECRQIIAVRKTSVSGGPKEVTIRYHATSGLIQTMKFERLPQARGGPRSILMDLISTEDLGPDFFNHNSHHDNTREVIEE